MTDERYDEMSEIAATVCDVARNEAIDRGMDELDAQNAAAKAHEWICNTLSEFHDISDEQIQIDAVRIAAKYFI